MTRPYGSTTYPHQSGWRKEQSATNSEPKKRRDWGEPMETVPPQFLGTAPPICANEESIHNELAPVEQEHASMQTVFPLAPVDAFAIDAAVTLPNTTSPNCRRCVAGHFGKPFT